MPGLMNAQSPEISPPPESNAIWSKKRDDITFDRLQKFWSELPLQARQELLRIDKQTLFEQARKNLYCSRCNGLLLEGFSQIVMYGKSLQHEDEIPLPRRTGVISKARIDNESDDSQDPSVHPWGGLAAIRDGILTLLDCFINARSLKTLQNVFDSARSRERERELLYPDACGGGGRGWISQGMTNYGRGHGTRETCALHTAKLSCDTLVDFWSALGEETRTSLLRMKEEDFIQRLMYRFDSKRFCRDCRRNVIREFKELKELKRLRMELRCTNWFCAGDTAFQYEVSEDTVQADWHQSFADTVGTFHHFEWAIGTGEGKSDVLEFEDVGMNGKVQVSGLDLGGLSACFITLKAWKLDGRCTELCVKAHALKGQACVHRRLVIGDGFVTITKGESIRRFFEHAEEAEEEEDDDVVDNDGNEFDGDGSRPQKHAKSPELAREFLLDAATVIFKEQVEKAFREGTTRQNAHSLFVSLALKMLEERVHVACKEIITLEKQIKLLEEEEKEKREEEERRERRRTKEREKKLRRKERLKGKERDKERKQNESNPHHDDSPTSANDSSTSAHDDSSPTVVDSSGDSVSDPGEVDTSHSPTSPNIKAEQSSNQWINTDNLKDDSLQHQRHVDEEFGVRDINDSSFTLEQSKSSRKKLRLKRETDFSRLIDGGHRPLREIRVVKTNTRSCTPNFGKPYNCSSNRLRDRENKKETTPDMPKAMYRGNCVLPKGKFSSNISQRQVWEPTNAWKKGIRGNSGSAVVSNQSEGTQFDKAVELKSDVFEGSEDGGKTFLTITSSSSSNNCSSCLSEGDSSSSGGQNTESFSTSDSEDATQQSQGRENTIAEFEMARNEPKKAAQISDHNGGFGFFQTHPQQQQQHILPMHNQSIHMPVFSSPEVGYHYESPTVSWKASHNGFISCHDPNHLVYAPNTLGYSLLPPRYSEIDAQFNHVQTISPLINAQHIYAPNHKEQQVKNSSVAAPVSSMRHSRPSLNGKFESACDDNSSFSLFHFGGPVAWPTGKSTPKSVDITCSREDTTIEEYNLFSAGNGVRFSIF